MAFCPSWPGQGGTGRAISSVGCIPHDRWSSGQAQVQVVVAVGRLVGVAVRRPTIGGVVVPAAARFTRCEALDRSPAGFVTHSAASAGIARTSPKRKRGVVFPRAALGACGRSAGWCFPRTCTWGLSAQRGVVFPRACAWGLSAQAPTALPRAAREGRQGRPRSCSSRLNRAQALTEHPTRLE